MNERPAGVPPASQAAASEPEDPAGSVARFAHASVLVIGDLMLDRYIHGRVTRVSPEAPVPVLSEEREVALPGGAGAVVRALTALGAAVAFISVVGDDPAGSDLTGLVGGQPNVEPWLLVEGGRTTTVKTRYLADGRHLLRSDREQTTPIPAKLAERVLRIARDAMAATSLTVLSDYQKGMLTEGLPAALVAAAAQAGRGVIAAPKGAGVAAYAGADVLVLGREDLAIARGRAPGGSADGSMTGGSMPGGSMDDAEAEAAALRAEFGFGAVLVTDAGPDLILVEGGGTTRAASGAGAPVAGGAVAGALVTDAVVAVLAAGLATRLALPAAVRLAGLAAGLARRQPGIGVARAEDLLAAVAAAG